MTPLFSPHDHLKVFIKDRPLPARFHRKAPHLAPAPEHAENEKEVQSNKKQHLDINMYQKPVCTSS